MGRSARTIQAHLVAIKGFTKWLSENQKLSRDPLASVRKPNPETDRRRERRILLHEEWRQLETSLLSSNSIHQGMSGLERWMLYRTAIETGLRAAELQSLSRGRLFLAAERPYITCKAGSTKNRKDACQYIQPELAASLQAHIAMKSPKTPVFQIRDRTKLAKLLRHDLEEARKE